MHCHARGAGADQVGLGEHVMEMAGRLEDGLGWVLARVGPWSIPGRSISALFPLKLGQYNTVLALFPIVEGLAAFHCGPYTQTASCCCRYVSIARGRCVVTQDLIAALQSGQLAGAGLDVVDPEPLPADSPLWAMRNVLITPHVAILGTPYRQKWEAILLENCRRFAAGQPLLNVVDKEKWY
jgi:hypothetical protein